MPNRPSFASGGSRETAAGSEHARSRDDQQQERGYGGRERRTAEADYSAGSRDRCGTRPEATLEPCRQRSRAEGEAGHHPEDD